MKYPIGIQTFETIINDGYVYVDKTALVYSLATKGKVYFLSRPRRFGKSLLLSTLKSYFLGQKDLFKGLAIEKLEKEWNIHPVFHLSFGGQNYNDSTTLDKVLEGFVAQIEDKYGRGEFAYTLGSRFRAALENAHRKTGRRCVVLIDEYDKPLLDVMGKDIKMIFQENETTVEDYNHDVLQSFYSVFKEADPDLKFVMLTGVTKFSQVSVFSGFNQLKDISMYHEYETLCGISDAELEAYFKKPIEEMAAFNGFTTEEMREELKKQYDGYHFSQKLTGVYNPFSFLSALDNMQIDNYWFRTGTPSYLMRLLEKHNGNLDKMTGKYYSQYQFEDYRANSEQPLPMIFQSGYLTIKQYDRYMRTFLLDFPNVEVKNGFVSLVANSYFKRQEADSTDVWVREAVRALRSGELDNFRSQLTAFLASIPYTVRRKENERERERYFNYTFYLIFRIASCYTVYTEKEQSEGRLDCVVETPDYIYIFEFKLDGTAEEALAQINARGYATEYQSSPKKLYKVGVNFSSEKGTVDGWAVEKS